jgi:hypothetical protein
MTKRPGSISGRKAGRKHLVMFDRFDGKEVEGWAGKVIRSPYIFS